MGISSIFNKIASVSRKALILLNLTAQVSCAGGERDGFNSQAAEPQAVEAIDGPSFASPDADLFYAGDFYPEWGDIFAVDYSNISDEGEAQAVQQLKITSVVPSSGSHKGGEVVTIHGVGFDESIEIFFDGKAAYNLFLINDGIVNCSTPPSPPSKVAVRVVRGDGEEAVLEDGFEFTSKVAIKAISPESGSQDGGTPVVVKGSGFTEGTRFLFGTREAISVTIQDSETAYMITPEFDYIPPLYGEKTPEPGKPYFVNLHAVKGEETFTLKKGFRYIVGEKKVADDFTLQTEILAVSPAKGDIKGGTKILIAGKNFKPGMEVYIGALPAKGVKLISSEMLSAITPQGSAGLSDVILRYGGSEKRLADGFEYTQEFKGVLLIEPSRGSQAGGTIVKIIGSGLPGVADVYFGEKEAVFESRISPNLIIAKTPFVEEPSEVELFVSGVEATSKKFLFYNPANKSGGTSGEKIDGAVNVSIFDSWTGKALKKAFVIVGSEATTPHKGRTDDRGQITFSDIGLEGRIDVTAIKEGYSAMTIAHFDAENITLHLSPTTPPQPGDTPPAPVEPINCKLRGVVVDVEKYIPIPEGIEGKRKAYCETTSSSIFGYNPPPGPLSIVNKNGEFEVFSRSGKMAVVCYAGIETAEGAFIPLRMGLTRNIVCKKSERIEGIKVYLTIPMEEQYFFRLSQIPEYFAEVKKPTIDVSLHIPMNGYLKFNRDFVEIAPRLYLAKYFPTEGNLELDGDGYTVYTTVRTGTQNNIPYSVNLLQKLKSVRRGEFLFVDGGGFRLVDTAIKMPVEDMAVDADGNLLAVSSGGGIYRYDGSEFYIFPSPEKGGVPLYSIGVGEDGSIYVGGEGGRIFKLGYPESGSQGWEVISAGWNSPSPVREIVESDGAVFFAGGNKVQVLKDGLLETEVVDSPPYKIDIRTALFYGGKLFVGSSDGLVLVRENGGYTPVYAAGGAVYASCEYEGKLYMAGASGMIIEYDGGDFVEKHYEPFRDIFVIARAPDGRLFFAGERGYILINDGGTLIEGDAGQDNDYLAAADYDGSLILAGRGLVLIEPVLSFPVFEYPLDNGQWDGLKLKIKEFSGVKPSYHQFLFSLKTGYLFYNIVAGGEITEIALPPLKAITGIDFPPPDYKRLNLTSSLSPDFNIDQFSGSSMNFYKKKGYSVNVIGFY